LKEEVMPRPVVWEPEECLFPQGRLELIQVLVRKTPDQPQLVESARATFSIALVKWDGEVRLAFRYDGDEEHPNGWPSSNSYPSWDILPRPMQALLMPMIPLMYHAMVLEFFGRQEVIREEIRQ
jgi:hypothetical protein